MTTGNKIIYAALCMILLQACSADDDGNYSDKNNSQQHAIRFSSDMVTRAGETQTHELLGGKFVVFGTKATSSESVFSGVDVTYSNGSWTYTDLKNWDMTATQYQFAAYSVGKGTGGESATYATVSTNASINGFTFNGTKEQLLTCYFTNRNVVESSAFGNTVNLAFNQLAAKVNMQFYSSIENATVKDLTFSLYTETAVIPTAGPYTVTYDINNNAVLTHVPNLNEGSENVVKELTLKQLESGKTIGESDSTATSTGDCLVLPMTASTTKLKIKVKYKTVKEGVEKNEEKTAVILNSINWQFLHRYVYLLNITSKGIECIPLSEDWDNDYRH